jgi:competence protein ComGC
MNANRTARGFTVVEMLVVIVITVVALVLIVPAVNSAREAGRRAYCLNKTVQISLAMQNYAFTFNGRFPPSASIITAPDGKTRTVGGWSILVRLLPFIKNVHVRAGENNGWRFERRKTHLLTCNPYRATRRDYWEPPPDRTWLRLRRKTPFCRPSGLVSVPTWRLRGVR